MNEQSTLHPRRFAEWHERFLAYLVDMTPLVILFAALVMVTDDSESYLPIGLHASNGSSGFSFMISGMPSVVHLVATLGWFAYNWLLGQGRTGQTFGKQVMDIAVLDASRRPIGPGLTFVRQIAHVLDFLPCFLGYLWSAWDRESRTFADMMMNTRVYRV
jgi:uncharacterized RDD family membrane protein YckC